MRIAAIGPLEVPSVQGGMSRHCEELYPRLVRRGHEVTLFCRSGPASLDGVRVKTLPIVRRRGLERLQLGLVASVLASAGRFDVVHYHALVNTPFSFVPRIRALRTLVTVHRLEWADEKWGSGARSLLRAGEWIALHSATAVIAVSRTLSGDLTRRYPGARIHYVPNGVTSLPAPDPLAVARLGLARGRYLLYVGRIVPEKGVDVLVDAFAGIGSAFPGVELAVVGAPRHSEQYASALRARSPAGVRFLGVQSGPALSALYEGAVAFVTPSVREGLPLGVLEAMHAGCCVVASDIPEHREAVDGTGVFFSPGRPEELASALRRVLADPAAASETGRAARTRILTSGEYDWERVAYRTDEILRSLSSSA